MLLTQDNENIPYWLSPYIKKNCPYCGAPIVDDGPETSTGFLLTQRWCPNIKCQGHMGYKILEIAKYLKIVGIGEKTAIGMVYSHQLENHLQAIPYLCAEKPYVHLWEVGKLAQIRGISDKWQELTRGYFNFTDYFENAKNIPPIIEVNRQYLEYAESFFRLKPPLSRRYIEVMVSGSIHGFSNRNDYIAWLNEQVGGYIQIVVTGKKLSVCALVKEPSSADHSKTDYALDHGIPIFSSEEFTRFICDTVKQMESEEHI